MGARPAARCARSGSIGLGAQGLVEAFGKLVAPMTINRDLAPRRPSRASARCD